MKKNYTFLVLALLFSLAAMANNVIVKGHITFNNGAPAVNQPVWISSDSLTTPTSCIQTHVVYTNANGYYTDTLNCSGNIVKIRIAVLNCNGVYLVENPQVNTTTNLVERNFTLCDIQQTCEAKFVFNTQNLSASFQSVSTTAPGTAITSYSWYFGDGTTATGASVTHSFATSGTYPVTLYITAANGCSDSVTKNITVINAAGTCHAQFRDSSVNGNKFFFFSGGSSVAPNDTIQQRIWSFGDGATISSSNLENIYHIYQASGTYTVCLKIISMRGCIDSACKTITVSVPNTNCQSVFSYQRTNTSAPYTVAFNSAGSRGVTATDSIITRHWNFGDGVQLSGNNIAPVHSYTAPGTYQVCLKIVSAAGCEKTECKMVIIAADSACHANFNYIILNEQGKVKFTNTSSTAGTSTQYYWLFDSSGYSTAINPEYIFTPGTHNVCLKLFTATGCRDSVCKTIFIAPPPAPAVHCEAAYTYSGVAATPGTGGFKIMFNSHASHASSATADSIRERIWIWGDGTVTTGNLAESYHVYNTAGSYNVCLVIRTNSGCSDTVCKTINVPLPNQLQCQSRFTYEYLPNTSATGKSIRFNSTTSTAVAGDSIISRKWEFGDGSILTGNEINPLHLYQQPGTYNVCLTIKTRLNCEKKECKLVVIPQVTGACVPHFTWQRTGAKQITFNSSSSWVPANDSIVQRKWNFGDATSVLGGNIVAPVHNYQYNGVYTVSLRIITKLNCEKTFYATVNVQDSVTNPPTADRIRIVSLYPTPATTQMQAVVWSLQNNVQAELAVYDIYGMKKWSMNKVLMHGDNVTVVPTASLATGPYYFRVTTMFGVRSRAFFKQ